jgi:hypothetical protein
MSGMGLPSSRTAQEARSELAEGHRPYEALERPLLRSFQP